MPKITHRLADGTVLDSIAGHVVRYEDCPEAYSILALCVKKQEENKNE